MLRFLFLSSVVLICFIAPSFAIGDSHNPKRIMPAEVMKKMAGDDGWQLTEPLRLPASGTRIEGLFDVLFDAKVIQYFDGILESASNMFEEELRFELQGDTTRQIMIGGSAGGNDRYVRRDDRAPLMRANFVEGFQWPSSYMDYVSTKWTGINRYSVKGIQFESPDGSGSLQRTDDGWQAKDGSPREEKAVLAWLVRLLGCEVSAWSAESAAATRVTFKVTLELEQGDPVTLSWSSGKGGRSSATSGVHASFDRDPPAPPGDWF